MPEFRELVRRGPPPEPKIVPWKANSVDELAHKLATLAKRSNIEKPIAERLPSMAARYHQDRWIEEGRYRAKRKWFVPKSDDYGGYGVFSDDFDEAMQIPAERRGTSSKPDPWPLDEVRTSIDEICTDFKPYYPKSGKDVGVRNADAKMFSLLVRTLDDLLVPNVADVTILDLATKATDVRILMNDVSGEDEVRHLFRRLYEVEVYGPKFDDARIAYWLKLWGYRGAGYVEKRIKEYRDKNGVMQAYEQVKKYANEVPDLGQYQNEADWAEFIRAAKK